MATFKLCLQFFLLLSFVAPHVISSARNLHIHKSSSRLLFPKHLEGSHKGDKIEGIHIVKTYLQRYGYLSKNATDNNSVHVDDPLLFDDFLESAIKSYQKFFKLNVSGILDKETLGQMSRPRCGVPDHFLRFNNETGLNVDVGDSHYTFFPTDKRWPGWNLHLTYGFIHDFPTKFIEPVTRAFDTWDANTKFSFSLTSRTQTADIVISLERGDHGDGYPFDGPGGVLAHSFGPVDGRVHFDSDEPWTVGSNFEEFDVESVALHEIGHSLGLGHSAIADAVMWPDLDSGIARINLHPDDLAGIQALYH